ncbi:MAG: histone deacetylase [Candidatus Babeliales bacterium]
MLKRVLSSFFIIITAQAAEFRNSREYVGGKNFSRYGAVSQNKEESREPQFSQELQLPIVYSKHYNISFGLVIDHLISKLHPFDLKKYQKVHAHVTDTLGIDPRQIHEPKKVTDTDLCMVHTKEYLKSLEDGGTVAHAAEVSLLRLMPNSMRQKYILDPMRYATQGTVDAALLALKHGWAVNIGGGYHHAKREKASGFCIFADIPLAVLKVREQYPDMHVLIVDLDAHQGNGHEDFFKEDFGKPERKVYIFDMYHAEIFPAFGKNVDGTAQFIDYAIPLSFVTDTRSYISLLTTGFHQFIEALISKDKKPGLIIYNAGTDIWEEDAVGGLRVTKEGIIERDRVVFQEAQDRNIPIAMVTSGGYTLESANIIAKSLEQILTMKNIPFTQKRQQQ